MSGSRELLEGDCTQLILEEGLYSIAVSCVMCSVPIRGPPAQLFPL